MVDSSRCFSLVRGRAMRVTRLDACGAAVLGPRSTVVTEGFISVGFTANTEEGETISVVNAAGHVCISDEPAPTFTGYTVEVAFCGVDPDLYALMCGQPVVMDDQSTPQAVGFQMNSDVNLDSSGFSIELWSGVPSGLCTDGEETFGYLLVPFLKGGVIGDFTIENAAINFTLTGAKSKDGNAWGVGPYDVLVDDDGLDSPLLANLPTTNHLHMQLVSLQPPVDACGTQPLGTEDTTATPGSPSVPAANSYYPEAMEGVTSDDPEDAWTTGQYAEDWLGDKYYWDGDAWVAGISP